jgi:hypothetical protein
MERTDDAKQSTPPVPHGGQTSGSAAGEPGAPPVPLTKRGKGILWWGGFLLLMSIWSLFSRPLPPGSGIRFEDFDSARIAATGSAAVKGLQVVGGIIAFALCLWWYRLAGRLVGRPGPLRILGGGAFLLATLLLPVAFGMPGQLQVLAVRFGGKPSAADLLLPLLFALVAAGLLVLVAYVLRFKRAGH